jgi:hypothetical protein
MVSMPRWPIPVFGGALAVLACTAPPVPPPVLPAPLEAMSVTIGPLERAYADAVSTYLGVCPRCPVPTATPGDVPGIASIDVHESPPVIRYDVDRLTRIIDLHGIDAVVGVFAHELGHAHNYHRGSMARCPLWATTKMVALCKREELSADAFAGCLLRVAGRDPGAFAAWVSTTSEARAHPDGGIRAEATMLGAQLCGVTL